MRKTDTQLQRDVIDELRWDPKIGGAEIGVAAKDGVVTLTGQVDSYAKKYLAVKAAERVHGVHAVAENVTVELMSSSKRTDTEIAHAVASRLTWDVDIPEEAVKARVQDGWVWLEGAVDWQYQRDSAERAVRFLTGVKGISNLVTIRKRVSVPDVQKRIEDAITRHASSDAKHVTVQARDGHVTLLGSVGSYAQKLDAENAAWAAPGVIAVDDRIAVAL